MTADEYISQWLAELDGFRGFLDEAIQAKSRGESHRLGAHATFAYLLFLGDELARLAVAVADIEAEGEEPDADRCADVERGLYRLRALFGAVIAPEAQPPAP